MTVEEQFWNGVTKKDPNECWEWKKSLTVHGGYGQFNHKGRLLKAHRVSYELHKGPIPPNMFVCHTCDNPKCCNPNHLYAGTPAQNWKDCKERNRAHKLPILMGEQIPCSKLKEKDVQEIRESSLPGTVLAKKYGVSRTSISKIRLRKTWKHLV